MVDYKELSWRILELKLGYYHPNLIHADFLSYAIRPDAEYDAIEDAYLKACIEHSVEPTAQQMVGFDFERPSCRFVALVLGNPKPEHWKRKP